jgi:hypothetical protein
MARPISKVLVQVFLILFNPVSQLGNPTVLAGPFGCAFVDCDVDNSLARDEIAEILIFLLKFQ